MSPPKQGTEHQDGGQTVQRGPQALGGRASSGPDEPQQSIGDPAAFPPSRAGCRIRSRARSRYAPASPAVPFLQSAVWRASGQADGSRESRARLAVGAAGRSGRCAVEIRTRFREVTAAHSRASTPVAAWQHPQIRERFPSGQSSGTRQYYDQKARLYLNAGFQGTCRVSQHLNVGSVGQLGKTHINGQIANCCARVRRGRGHSPGAWIMGSLYVPLRSPQQPVLL